MNGAKISRQCVLGFGVLASLAGVGCGSSSVTTSQSSQSSSSIANAPLNSLNANVTEADFSTAATSRVDSSKRAIVEFKFNSGSFSSFAMLATNQNSDGLTECDLSADTVTLIEDGSPSNRTVIWGTGQSTPTFDAITGGFNPIKTNTRYRLQIARSSKCNLPEFSVSTILKGDSSRFAANSIEAKIAKQCKLPNGDLISLLDKGGMTEVTASSNRTYVNATHTELCALTSTYQGVTPGTAATKMNLDMLYTDLNFIGDTGSMTLAFDANTQFQTGTITCSLPNGGVTKKITLFDCSDVAIKYSVNGQTF
jgi:hypothetical protein